MARSHQNVDSLDAVICDAVISDDGVGADEDGCLLFEQRLNDWVDRRNAADEISSDAHLLTCVDCQELLSDYQAMLAGTKLFGSAHGDDVSESSVELASQTSFETPTGSARGQFIGWSTLLAVLFVFLGAPTGVPSGNNLNHVAHVSEEVSLVSVSPVHLESTDLASELSFVDLSGYSELAGYPTEFANQLVAVNPMVRVAPASCQSFFEMPTGRLLAAGLPAIDLAEVDMGQFSQIGQYWQHASRLPGIEPWQHSVNFAIGWFNQSPLPNENHNVDNVVRG